MQELGSAFILVILLVILFFPFGIGRFFWRWTLRTLLGLVGSPYYLWVWVRNLRAAKRRRRNYEILGTYVALLGGQPETLKYFRNLIENGIGEKELEKLIAANAQNLQQFEPGRQPENIGQKAVQEEAFKKMAAEQQEMLVESRLSLEQIKFREKLLEQLYHKIRKKYRL